MIVKSVIRRRVGRGACITGSRAGSRIANRVFCLFRPDFGENGSLGPGTLRSCRRIRGKFSAQILQTTTHFDGMGHAKVAAWLSRRDGMNIRGIWRQRSSRHATHSNQGCLVSLQVAVAVNVQAAVPASFLSVSIPPVDLMLGDLPTAHRALPIGRRIAGQGCHGARKFADMGCSTMHPRAPRIRFVYFPTTDGNDRWTACHQHLVTAEVLLDRALAAHAAGLRPMVPLLNFAAEARAIVRPPQGMFHQATLEYRRWYRANGTARAQPLTREALALRLAATDELSMKEARARVAQRSHALSAADQAWLINRRNTPQEKRPLNQAEFHTLVNAIDGAWQSCAGTTHGERANRQIALRVVAMLASLLDEYVASPFKVDALAQAFTERHLGHLRQTIENSRQAESTSGVLLIGPKAWFAAKAARMRAEHQIGLSMSPTAFPSLRLTVRPVIAVVGGRLRTFVHGWRRGDSSVAEVAPVFTAFG
ncbi:MAG: hypothetical protein ABI283_04410 [Rhodanobacter sp.]